MKLKHLTLTAALVATSAALLPSCNQDTAQAKVPAAPVAKQVEPTQERLLARANERWARIAKGDWIQAYDYLSPDQKQSTSLPQYLQNKQNHKYENPRVSEVVASDAKDAVLKITSLWTPQHEKFKQVKLEPGQSLTREIELIESWRWAENDWVFVRAQRPEDFYQAHPELLRSEPAKEPVKTVGTEPVGG